MPSLLPEEEFEDHYTDRFRDRLREHGIVLRYERDRAATDLGIHLAPPGSLELSDVKVWFRLKVSIPPISDGRQQNRLIAGTGDVLCGW